MDIGDMDMGEHGCGDMDMRGHGYEGHGCGDMDMGEQGYVGLCGAGQEVPWGQGWQWELGCRTPPQGSRDPPAHVCWPWGVLQALEAGCCP